MDEWISSDEADFPLWVHELDPDLHALNHKRACVWFSELDGQWQWEIETFHDSGIIAGGIAASQAEAMMAAEAAASHAS